MPQGKNNRDSGRGRRGRREQSEYDQKLIDLARVARVVAGGRRFRFRATLVIGNRHGRVGFAIAKGADVSAAIQKAFAQAKKNMITVALSHTTIPHEIQERVSGANVLLKPAVPGTGIIAGGPVRAVVELAGISDILSKMIGSGNKTNNALATFKALSKLSDPVAMMALRGKELPKKQKKEEATTPAVESSKKPKTSKKKKEGKE